MLAQGHNIFGISHNLAVVFSMPVVRWQYAQAFRLPLCSRVDWRTAPNHFEGARLHAAADQVAKKADYTASLVDAWKTRNLRAEAVLTCAFNNDLKVVVVKHERAKSSALPVRPAAQPTHDGSTNTIRRVWKGCEVGSCIRFFLVCDRAALEVEVLQTAARLAHWKPSL